MTKLIKAVLIACALTLSGCATLTSLIAGPATPYQQNIILLCARINSAAIADPALIKQTSALCDAPPSQTPTSTQTDALANLLLAITNVQNTKHN